MKEIIYEWNPWWSKKFEFSAIKRDKFKDIFPWIKRREIISIIGVRRSGKTTLLYEIIDYLIKENKINPENLFFIKADDDRVNKNKLIDSALDEYMKWINPSSKIFLFIDEVQEISNWQKTVKRIYDLKKDIKIFISGSNASILKEELSSLLAGRYSYFEIFPFNFSEFLRAKKIALKKDLYFSRNKIRHYLLEYVSQGSFPEVVLETEEKIKKELISFYFDSIFYRDIIKRGKIRNPAKTENLVKYFLQNIAVPSNFTKIGKLLDLTTDSVVEYMKSIEDAYLLFQVNLFGFSYKKQVINPKKIYCVDTGIRNMLGFNFSRDIGRLYENLVFVNLRKQTKEVYYWKNSKGFEVDFVIKEGLKIKQIIQVCYDLKEAKKREVRALFEAGKELKCNRLLIITEDKEETEKVNGKTINYIPLWKWLLETK